ncbi:MAG: hypothetical protein ACI87E_001655, partial [Mariniblastus sp.]
QLGSLVEDYRFELSGFRLPHQCGHILVLRLGQAPGSQGWLAHARVETTRIGIRRRLARGDAGAKLLSPQDTEIQFQDHDMGRCRRPFGRIFKFPILLDHLAVLLMRRFLGLA